jgi:multicomponent Na+:H+ antiporter subunit A
MSLFWPVLVLLSLALLAPILFRILREFTGWALGAAVAALFLFFVQLLPLPADGAHEAVLPWVPTLGLELGFRVDGLAATFALLITGIGALVVIYAGGYLHADDRLGRFYAFLLLFAAAMLGLVLSDSLIGMFVF